MKLRVLSRMCPPHPGLCYLSPGLVQRPLITLPVSPASCLFSTQSQSLKGKGRSCVCSKPAAYPISLQ